MKDLDTLLADFVRDNYLIDGPVRPKSGPSTETCAVPEAPAAREA